MTVAPTARERASELWGCDVAISFTGTACNWPHVLSAFFAPW